LVHKELQSSETQLYNEPSTDFAPLKHIQSTDSASKESKYKDDKIKHFFSNSYQSATLNHKQVEVSRGLAKVRREGKKKEKNNIEALRATSNASTKKMDTSPNTHSKVSKELMDEIASKVFTIREGYTVTFEWEDGQCIATVEETLPTGKRTHRLQVYLLPGMTWEQLANMNEGEQQYRFEEVWGKDGLKGHLLVGKMGIMGGGKTSLHEAVLRRDINRVRQLIAEGLGINATDEDQRTPLWLAAMCGYAEIFDLLIASGADKNVKDKQGNTPLHAAIWWNADHMAKRLIGLGVNINMKDNSGQTPLNAAADRNKMEIVKQLITFGANKDTADERGWTPLHWAAFNGHKEIVTLLISSGANKEAKNNEGASPLFKVVYKGSLEMVKHLIALGADRNTKNKQSNTLLHEAAIMRHLEIMRYFISSGADKNTNNNVGNTPLHEIMQMIDRSREYISIVREYIPIVQYLFEISPDLHIKNNAGFTPIDLASTSNHLEYIPQIFSIRSNNINSIGSDGLTHLQRAIQRRDLPLVKQLIDSRADTNLKNSSGKTPLHVAVEQEDIGIIKYLLDAGANKHIADNSGNTPIHLALQKANRPSFGQLLTTLSININEKDNNGHTQLYRAVVNKNIELVKQLLTVGAEINTRDNNGLTPLHVAVQQGNTAMVSKLLAEKADKNAKNNTQQTPLHLATIQGNVEIIEVLLAIGADKDVKDNSGKTAVHLALQNSKQALAKQLLGALGVDIHAKDSNGNTLLHHAVLNEDLEMVKQLIDLGVDKNAKDKNNNTPLHLAVETSNIEIAKQLIELGADKNPQAGLGNTPLHRAVGIHNLKLVRQLIDLGVDRNAKNAVGLAPLHVAVYTNSLAMVECLTQLKVDLNAKDMEGDTPLHKVYKGRISHNVGIIVKELLRAGADKNAINNYGKTPLHLVVKNGNVELAKQLLEPSTDKNVKDNDGDTPLHIAVEEGNIEMVKLLMELGVDKNAKNGDGDTPIHLALAHSNPSIAQQLLVVLEVKANEKDSHGNTLLHRAILEGDTVLAKHLLSKEADKNAKNNVQTTPLHLAAAQGNSAIVEALLAIQADKASKDKDGNTPLHLAAKHGHVEIVKQLIDAKADKNSKNNNGWTPLHKAVSQENAEVVKILIGSEVDKNARDKESNTSLHLAVKKGNLEIVKQLLAAGIDKNAKGKDWNTPLHMAVEEGKEKVAKYLVQSGANLHATNNAQLTPIDLAAIRKHLNCVKSIFSVKNTNINIPGKDSLTHLHRAVQRKDVKLVEQLIDCHADVKAADETGKTPFHYAALHGHTKLLKHLSAALKPKNLWNLLSRSNASLVDIPDAQGCTPLHLAVARGHIGTVKFLLQEKANLYAKDKNGLTPLHKALAAQQIELIKALLKIPGYSPLEYAVENNDISLVKELLAAGIDINTINSAGKSVLYVAFEKGYIALTQELIRLGAQVNATDHKGRSLLHHTVINNQLTVTNALLGVGADIHLADTNGFTALHLAAQHNQPEIAKQLIALGAVVDAQDKQQMTPLHWAAQNSHAAVAITLIQAGADLQAFDEQGYIPLDYAMQQGNLELVKVIAAASEYKIHAMRCAVRAHRQITLPKQQQNTTRKNKRKHRKKASPIKRFLETYPAQLPSEERVEFNTKIAPILKKHLPRAQHPLQEKVIEYFNNQGCFYPAILQGYDVQDWVYEALILDICKEALANKDEVGFAKFKERFQTTTSYYQDEEREKLLIAIKEKQLIYQLDLLLICDILTYLTPFKASQALKLIALSDPAWLSSLRLAWLSEQVKTLQHFTPSQRSQISYAGAVLPCKPELIDRFIAGLQTEKDFRNVEDLFAFITKNSVPENILLLAFYQKPKQAGDSILKAWKHYIACELLKNKINQLYPAHVSLVEKRIATLLRNHWLYEEMNTTLDKLLIAVPADMDATIEAQRFIDALDLLIEYTVAEPVCKQVLVEIIQQKPSQDWEKELHPRIIAATFGKSHERSVEEIIDYIVEKSPHTNFAGNKEELQKSYHSVLAAYQSTSLLLPENKTTIAKWGKAEITKWATRVKGSSTIKSMSPATQYEVLAVVKRVVELTHRHAPRATQLLALLVFLNHAPGKGRLAQINTGEGKSLIVAMLAAIHALQGKKVDVVTTSTELSVPEVTKQSGFFAMLGLSVGENSQTDNNRAAAKELEERKRSRERILPLGLQLLKSMFEVYKSSYDIKT
jgi:ankyrin repeat protein